MSDVNIGSADYSNMKNIIEDFSINFLDTDAPTGLNETKYQIENWSEYFGYYNSIPELQTAVNTKCTWTCGAGFNASEPTKILLSMIKGNGKDTFLSILLNLIKVYVLAGDTFSEIIRDKNVLINLKPLDPSSIVMVANEKGIIKRYEQVTKTKKVYRTFKPNEIFHVSRNRIADQIHGVSVVPSVKWIIDARNEAMTDWKKVLHRNIQPLWIFHLDTDDTNVISGFKTKMDRARSDGENMYIPKGAVVPELISTATNASLNPLNWINQLNDYFFQAVNCPQIIIGNAKEFTDASGKIVYLSYEQSVKAEQLFWKEQLLAQLNLDIDLIFPASLQNELISSNDKSPSMNAIKPNDQMVELEGKK